MRTLGENGKTAGKPGLTLLFVSVCVSAGLIQSCAPLGRFFQLSPPEVIRFTPEGDMARADSLQVSVSFSRAMDKTSTENAFSIAENGTEMEGCFAWEADTLIFRPSRPFRSNAAYRFGVSVQAEDLIGNSLTKDFAHTFRTGEISPKPEVRETSPQDGEKDVGVWTPLVIRFDSAMNRESVLSGLRIFPEARGEVLSDAENRVFSFIPSAPLRYGSEYRVSLSKAAQNAEGFSLSNEHTFVFKTEERFSPAVCSVRCSSSGLEMHSGSLINSGVERDEAFLVTFETPLPLGSRAGLASLRNGPSLYLLWDTEGSSAELRPQAPLDWGEVYELLIGEKSYRFEVSGPRSEPPSISGIYFSKGTGESYTLLTAFGSCDFSSGSCFFDIHVRHAEGSSVSVPSFADAWAADSANGCVDISSLSVIRDPEVPVPLGERTTVFRVFCCIQDNLYPGMVRISVGKTLEDSRGNRMKEGYTLSVNR